jgi:alkylation response protein AidB-like acyl-CoA dehydrogenase
MPGRTAPVRKGRKALVNLDLTDDQEALRRTVREFFEKESPTAVVRAAEPLGFDDALWRKVLELGLASIAVPEDRGGAGAGLVDLAIAAECVGQAIAPVPLIEVAVANNLIASAMGGADATVSSLGSAAIAGDLLATFALHPATGDVARLVPAGAVADLVVVLRGDELLLLQPSGPPAEAVPNLGAMPIADRRIDAGALVLARGEAAVRSHRRAVVQWQVLMAAALAGLSAKALEIAVEYVMQRRAFGVLIANFQTIQHRLADNAIAFEGARLLAYKAAWAHDVGLPTADRLGTMSFLFAAESAFKTASESLHFHGGYGYTLEYDIQLFFRRAKAWPHVAGDRRAAYAELARGLVDSKEG